MEFAFKSNAKSLGAAAPDLRRHAFARPHAMINIAHVAKNGGLTQQMFDLHTAGTMRLTVCIGPYALKFARWQRGRRANQRERLEWDRATPERRKMLCPMLLAAPFGLVNIMRRAVPLTREQQLQLLHNGGFPDWDYMPPGPKEPFEYKESDWGYLAGRLVALDYAGWSRE